MQTFERIVGIPGVSNLGIVEGFSDENYPQGNIDILRSARPDGHLGYTALKDMLGIKTILCLQQEDYDEPEYLKLLWYPLFTLMPVSIEKYQTILAAIDEAEKPLLIHCLQGHDRTGVICAAYRITHGWSFEDAISEMKAYGFLEIWFPLMESLEEFAESLGGQHATSRRQS